jgi:hypothetical protein
MLPDAQQWVNSLRSTDFAENLNSKTRFRAIS